MNKYGRSRKEQAQDRKNKHQEFEERVDSRAKRWLEHDAYKPWTRKELPRHTVTSYLESKGFDVKGVIADGQSKGTE